MRYGTIIQYFPDKKFGFIRPDSGQDVFFHISALDADETPPQIKLGQAVKYELAPRGAATPTGRESGGQEPAADQGRPEKLRAKRVVLIDKLPGATLAEFDASEKARRHRRARQKKPTWRR